MMNAINKMNARQLAISSRLCIGLDTELSKIPQYLLSEESPIVSFNQQIIEATSEFASAYKINTAF